MPNFLRSLFLTCVLSFSAPVLLTGVALASFALLGCLPILEAMSQASALQILQFLSVFGSGCPFDGLIIIGVTCGLVGALFDTYNFYRYQTLRGH